MRGMSKKDALACQVSLGLFAGLLGIASTAHGAPIHDGGTLAADGVKAGNVAIDTATANTTKITSTQQNNVIGWKDFSIKSTEKVEFDGGVTGAAAKNYLNIVTGNVTSRIDGEMKGGNNVYIANTHGVVFGKGASVDVGNLYVTTQDLTGVDYSQSVNSSKIGNGTVIDTSTGKAAASAKADVVSLVDNASGKNLKADKIVLEGKSVRIMNDANIESSEVYTLANTDPLQVEAGGTKTVRPYTGYVHVGHTNTGIPTDPLPSVGAAGKYKNLTGDNLYKLIGSQPELNLMEMNKNYMLRSDITMTGTHAPIGTDAAPFTGKFDGMFHEIKDMTLPTGDATNYSGLFGNTRGAEIANVGIRDANLSSLDYGGAVVGKAGKGTHIFNVYNEVTSATPAATKTIGISTGGHEVGGVVGRIEGGNNPGEEASLDHAYNTDWTAGGGNSRVYSGGKPDLCCLQYGRPFR